MSGSRPRLLIDASFERRVNLDDGRRVLLRWIRPTDAWLLREGFARLSMQSRRMRFFASLHGLSDDLVRYLTAVDGVNHAALVALSVPDDRCGVPERGVGVARFVRSGADSTIAELAVTVADDAQGHGLGHLLIETIAAAALERGIETFTMNVHGDNQTVHSLLARRGAQRRRRDGEVVEYTIATRVLVASSARRAAAELSQQAG